MFVPVRCSQVCTGGIDRWGGREDWEDPVKFILRTWPWREEVEALSTVLLPVNTITPASQVSEDAVKDDPLVRTLSQHQSNINTSH